MTLLSIAAAVPGTAEKESQGPEKSLRTTELQKLSREQRKTYACPTDI